MSAPGATSDKPTAAKRKDAMAPEDEAERTKRERRAEQERAKRQKLFGAQRVEAGLRAIVTPTVASAHPFDADPHDAAETPLEAYRDIEPLLFHVARELGKAKKDLIIYDPFYCEGSVLTHLMRLGFERVLNSNEDFYEVQRQKRVPPHDVLVTNPPFSGEHMQRLLEFVVGEGQRQRPFFLLLPEFVARKTYFKSLFGTAAAGSSSSTQSPPLPQAQQPLYVGPTVRPYQFSAPGRGVGGDAPLVARPSESLLPFQVFAAKFECFWYAGLGAKQGAALSWWQKKYARSALCVVAADVADVPRHVDATAVAAAAAAAAPSARKSWRKKLSRQRKKIAKAAAGPATQ